MLIYRYVFNKLLSSLN